MIGGAKCVVEAAAGKWFHEAGAGAWNAGTAAAGGGDAINLSKAWNEGLDNGAHDDVDDTGPFGANAAIAAAVSAVRRSTPISPSGR